MKLTLFPAALFLAVMLPSRTLAVINPGAAKSGTVEVAGINPDLAGSDTVKKAALPTVEPGEKEKPVTLTAGGYASWLHTAMFEKPSESWINSSMLHNRLNFKAYAGSKVTFALELRNRFVTGDMIALDPGYVSGLASDNGWIDLSWNISDGSSYVLNSMIDRAYVDLTLGRLQITAGRQRINWSQSLVWNPNDIFNTYSFFDFDYVERPGSDAVRLVYSTGPSSAAEAAVKVSNQGELTAAALFRFSLLNTDLQFFAGETDEEFFTTGTGWSGAVGPFSVRGEATLFAPFEGSEHEGSTVIATAGVDRAFSDRLTAMVQLMYSNRPLALDSFTSLYEGGLTARDLAFSEFSAVGQVTWAPMPLLSISVSAMWYPDLDGWYAGPSVDISLAENVDFSFLWQHFDMRLASAETKLNLGFIRIRYSF